MKSQRVESIYQFAPLPDSLVLLLLLMMMTGRDGSGLIFARAWDADFKHVPTTHNTTIAGWTVLEENQLPWLSKLARFRLIRMDAHVAHNTPASTCSSLKSLSGKRRPGWIKDIDFFSE